jgi:hypothetical protein
MINAVRLGTVGDQHLGDLYISGSSRLVKGGSAVSVFRLHGCTTS